MLLLDMDKKVDLREFISTLQNRTNERGKGVVLQDQGKPVAVVLAYEDYLELIDSFGIRSK
jgi:PHD/YefM family antitoxin component YafN of YafNO toxin-antitoxin module